MNIWGNKELIEILLGGGVVVMPTDTIYGLVGSALNKKTVERVYNIRKRAPEKPCIILIGDIKELEIFFIILSLEQKKVIEKYWFTIGRTEVPGPVSFILDCADDKFEYLHRGTKTLAFRLPLQADLRDFLKNTGPLIAPSANPEGFSSAIDVAKAKEYFADLVDLYIDGGEIVGKASKVIKLHKDGSAIILRE